MSYTFALAGNPNSGKTTLFNEITGSTQYVGNWPRVTIEKKEGKAKKFKDEIEIVDLPGIYSLSPYSMEEIITRDYIVDEKPDVVINIVDASNIERNLYLTTQLKELGVPVVVALNMMDIIKSRGDSINIGELERLLEVPVVPISASKGAGVRELIEKCLEVAQSATVILKDENHKRNRNTQEVDEVRKNKITYKNTTEYYEEYLDQITKLLTGIDINSKYNLNWVSLKLLENDENIIKKLNIPDKTLMDIESIREKLEKKYENDIETVIADARYKHISKIVSQTVKMKRQYGELTISDKIDKIVTNKIIAIPLFLIVMFFVFKITFGTIGGATVDWLDAFINENIAGTLERWFEILGVAEWINKLIVGGILGGVGGVLVFVPQIMILFLFLSILEDSGYMARAAFVMDRMLRKLGLSGKSFIPMLMGFGCSVPAIMATRTLENEKDRRLTIILIPFMSCGAKLPVYALFTAAFFAKNQSHIVFSLYVLGIVIAILSGILLKNTLFKGEVAPFVMELPPYRIPTLKGLWIHMWERAKGFIKKAGTIIFTMSVLIWFFQSFDFSFHMVEEPANSILGVIGKGIAPFFSPLGFGEWKSAVALLTGLLAKEVVVSTMGILNGIGEGAMEIATVIQTYFTPLKAYSFMVFTLLYTPCIAAFAAVKREMNSWKWALFSLAYQTGVAWLISFIIYQGGRLFGLG